jgi:hypothetical protein
MTTPTRGPGSRRGPSTGGTDDPVTAPAVPVPRTPPAGTRAGRTRRRPGAAGAPIPPDLMGDLVEDLHLDRATPAAREIPPATGADDPALDTRRPALPPLPPRTTSRRTRNRRSPWAAAAGVTTLVAVLACVYGTVNPKGEEVPVWGIVLIPALMSVTLLITARTSRDETRFDLRGIIALAFAIRCLGAFLRFQAPVDALVYHREGARIADALRGMDFFVATGRDVPGTGWIRYVSGLTHAFFLDDMFATYMVFTFLAFVGAFLCYKAFVRAVPDGDHKRYALLVFLWPSLVFWPSSIGKEAWMLFGLGIAAVGVARVLRGNAGIGLLVLALGLLTLSMVRPHIALMVVIGLAIALLARPGKATTVRTAGRIAAVVLLLVGGSIIAGRTSQVLKLDQDGTEDSVLDVANAFAVTQERTEQGGAAFSPPVVRSPADYPFAFVSVWFRPFPWEARGGGGEPALTQMLSVAENLALLGLILLSWRRLRELPRALLRIPYVTFAATYVVVFVYAFSVIGNFGILARQRTQGMVLFFVLLCLPIAESAKRRTYSTRGAAQGRARRALRSFTPGARTHRTTDDVA